MLGWRPKRLQIAERRIRCKKKWFSSRNNLLNVRLFAIPFPIRFNNLLTASGETFSFPLSRCATFHGNRPSLIHRQKINLKTWPTERFAFFYRFSCFSAESDRAVMNFRSQIRTIIKHVVCAECWLSSATDGKSGSSCCCCCCFLVRSFYFCFPGRPKMGWKIYERTSDWQIYWRENIEMNEMKKKRKKRRALSRMPNYFRSSPTNHALLLATVNTSFFSFYPLWLRASRRGFLSPEW